MTRGLFALDIDGVLTDGTVSMNAEGDETKRLSYRDIDAVFRARREGLTVALLAAEDTPVAARIAARHKVDNFIAGRRDKGAALRELSDRLSIPGDAICYIGDSAKDVEALEFAGLGLVPADADGAARNAADAVLSRAGGQGAVAEGLALFLTRLGGAASPVRQASYPGGGDRGRPVRAIRSLMTVLEKLEESALEDVLEAGRLLRETLESGGTIFTFGNGRSAADAQHLAAEIMGFYRGAPGAGRAVALTADTALLTALANDAGYGEIFALQIGLHGRPGDTAVAFTTSERSENILRGLAEARKNGLSTILVTGAATAAEAVADVRIIVPTTDTQRVQEVHGIVMHLLCELARSRT